jgi:ion channel
VARARPARLTHYGYLLLSSVGLLVIQGSVAPGAVQRVVVTALSGCCLILAVQAAQAQRKWIRAAFALAGMMLLVSVARAIGGGTYDGTARVMNAALIAVAPPAVAVGLVRDLRATGEVRLKMVTGVLALYILIGMFFAFVYAAIDQLGSSSFFADGTPATAAKALYFSFTTLATVGYGDYTARTDAGHTLSISEALIGQIYLVTVVSLIVSNLGRTRTNTQAPGEQDPPAADR